jgi:hypothetical protein
MPLLCAIRYLSNNGFTGPIPASIAALTRLASVYAPPPPDARFRQRTVNGLVNGKLTHPSDDPLTDLYGQRPGAGR